MEKGEFLGEGFDKTVHGHPYHPDRVIKEYFREAEKDKVIARGYLAKILYILFPDNIPYLHQSTSEPNRIIEEKKARDEEHKAMQMLVNKSDVTDDDISFAQEQADARARDPRVIEFINKMNDTGIRFDKGGMNFAFNEKEDVVYLDNVEPWRQYKESESRDEVFEVLFDSEKLFLAIDAVADPVKREQAKIYLARLNEALGREQNKRDNSKLY
ncbi:MAG: hypothetical protein AAB367_02225 [Patescibacteria group bacterium]